MKLIKALFVVIILLVLANVTLTNRAVDDSVVVADLDKKISLLQNQNTILRAEIASLGSLGNLSPKIAESGFVESPAVMALPTPSSVALR
ncbi:MAG: hypothetical protein ABII21_03300 [bacterium]